MITKTGIKRQERGREAFTPQYLKVRKVLSASCEGRKQRGGGIESRLKQVRVRERQRDKMKEKREAEGDELFPESS